MRGSMLSKRHIVLERLKSLASGVGIAAVTGGSVSLLCMEGNDDESATRFMTESFRSSPFETLRNMNYNSSVASCGAEILFPAGAPSISFRGRLGRQKTVKAVEATATKNSLESLYRVDWRRPIGEGAFGSVYRAMNRKTNQMVAIKKIPKHLTDNESFENEMKALLLLQKTGEHPNICSLHEHFEAEGEFFLVLDLVAGGEMFDYLVDKGAYSEADAARLFRQVASAIALLHGTGIVHSDLKPENLMMSTRSIDNATIQVVDFGCAHIIDVDLEKNANSKDQERKVASTPAYSPPEFIEACKKDKDSVGEILPSFDMWSLGVILYVMLTGIHPFDPYNKLSNAEIQEEILSTKDKSLRTSPFASHLSPDAMEVIEGLMHPDPRQRWTAHKLLEHPWVLGNTASTKKMEESDKRLAACVRHQTRLAANFFRTMIQHSNTRKRGDAPRRTSVLESAFRQLGDGQSVLLSTMAPDDDRNNASLSFSEIADLLSENMKDQYFPKDQVIYNEGDEGESMYFINSGVLEATSKEGYRSKRKAGDFFGTHALINDDGKRRHTVKCLSHVHAIEITRESYEKYVKADPDVEFLMAETERLSKRECARTILGLQNNLKSLAFGEDEIIFEKGGTGNMLYILEEGDVHLLVNGHLLRSLQVGEMAGEHAAFHKNKPYNVTAKCVGNNGCKLKGLESEDMHRLFDENPTLRNNFHDITLRRDFKKAIVAATHRPFPETEEDMKSTFDAIDVRKSGEIKMAELRKVMLEFDPSYSETDINEMLRSLDLTKSGTLTWAEFKNIFTISAKNC